MPSYIPIDLAQPMNKLGEIGAQQRGTLFPTNDYKEVNQYSGTHPDALATGDAQGKGTGGFLDTGNQSAGAIQDILERKSETVVNEFQPNKPYTTPSA